MLTMADSICNECLKQTLYLELAMPPDHPRTIPAVDVPTLPELGLGHLRRVPARTRSLFVARPLAAAAGALALAAAGRTAAALALVPLWYGWSLTLVHHMIHGSLGGAPALRRAALAGGGVLALHSGHALVATHLQHHRTDPGAPDPEGAIEYVPPARLPAAAVLFRYRLWAWGWRHGAPRRWVAAEVAAHVAVLGAALTHLGQPLSTVALALWAADAAFAVLAARGPQTNWGRPVPTPLVAVRCRLARWPLLAHNWHLEHHFYPDIPLPALARVAPALDGFLAERGALVVSLP
jgi:beta-carotene hydroxylase